MLYRLEDTAMAKSILTDKPSEAQIRQREAEKLDWQRFEILINTCLEHYIAIDTNADLKNFCTIVVNISNRFEGEEYEKIPNKGKHRLLGEVIEKAVNHDSIRKANGRKLVNHKQAFKSLVIKLVNLAHHNGYKLINESAYEYVATLLKQYGISDPKGHPYSGSTIRKWCNPSRVPKKSN